MKSLAEHEQSSSKGAAQSTALTSAKRDDHLLMMAICWIFAIKEGP